MSEKEELTTVFQGNSIFCRHLYHILSSDSENVFFSPISIHTVLSMVYLAAKGATKDSLASALKVFDPNVGAKGYNLVMFHLNNLQNVQLHIANKVYLKEGYKLQPCFKDSVQKHFLSDIEQVNFEAKVRTSGNINDWVKKKTNNKIKDLIQPSSLNKYTHAVLVGAIYFKGDWLDKFNPENTRTEKFYLNDLDTVDCQMMSRFDEYVFKKDQDLDAKVLELPFKNRSLSLIVILPNKRSGIADLEAKLLNTDLTKITKGMRTCEVNVKLPKFRIETTINLKDALTKLGLGIIFDDCKADFSGMLYSPEPLSVSEVIQKAFLEVNEEGAEAATYFGLMLRKCKFRPSPEEFFADHPFLLVLQVRQGDSSNILFKGRLSRPTY